MIPGFEFNPKLFDIGKAALVDIDVIGIALLAIGLTALQICLERGERYAWSVRARRAQEALDWSAPSLFQVAAGPNQAELEIALQVVRSYLEKSAGELSAPRVSRDHTSTSTPRDHRIGIRPLQFPLASTDRDNRSP